MTVTRSAGQAIVDPSGADAGVSVMPESTFLVPAFAPHSGTSLASALAVQK